MDATVFKSGKARSTRTLAIVVIVSIALIGAMLYLWWDGQPRGDTGSFLIPQGTMTDEEARAMLDAQAEASRITVSIRPVQELVDGQLHVNFVVPEGNNGLSERLEVEQDGAVVYRSGVVEPAHVIEWAAAPLAHAGSAVATIYAVNSAGEDFGNPVSVEVEVAED